MCVYSVFVGLILRDGVQIRLNVAVQNEVCISQRVVVDEIVQLRPLIKIIRHFVFHGGAWRSCYRPETAAPHSQCPC